MSSKWQFVKNKKALICDKPRLFDGLKSVITHIGALTDANSYELSCQERFC